MTFKEKHFKQAFGPLMFAAMMMIPSGCGKMTKGPAEDGHSGGLLDPTPVTVTDRYGTVVTLLHVEIPVYDENGRRLKDRWVLTHGLPNTKYHANASMYDLRRVRLNGGDTECYVRVDPNNAILSTNGGCGLFENYGDVMVISDINLDKYLGERVEKISKNTAKLANKKAAAATAEKADEAPAIEPTDSVASDTVVTNAADTLKVAVTDKVVADTLQRGL